MNTQDKAEQLAEFIVDKYNANNFDEDRSEAIAFIASEIEKYAAEVSGESVPAVTDEEIVEIIQEHIVGCYSDDDTPSPSYEGEYKAAAAIVKLLRDRIAVPSAVTETDKVIAAQREILRGYYLRLHNKPNTTVETMMHWLEDDMREVDGDEVLQWVKSLQGHTPLPEDSKK